MTNGYLPMGGEQGCGAGTAGARFLGGPGGSIMRVTTEVLSARILVEDHLNKNHGLINNSQYAFHKRFASLILKSILKTIIK